MKNSPIFLIGWFRSGTTLAWNLFRQNSDYTCYYEPFHESLIGFINGINNPPDPTHLHVNSYWDEYKHIPIDSFEKHWRNWYGRERFLLIKNDDADDLHDYIHFLINSADGTPVLKFVRACHRAEWLRDKFPNATIIHILRNPRDVWESLTKGNNDINSIYNNDNFINYVLTIGSDLNISSANHPYQRFYKIWLSGYQHVNSVSNDTWWYEDIIHPNQKKISEIKQKYNLLFNQNDLINTNTYKKQNEIWYLKQELSIPEFNTLSPKKLEPLLEKNYLKRINTLEINNLTKQIELERCLEKKYAPRSSSFLFYTYKTRKILKKLLRYFKLKSI